MRALLTNGADVRLGDVPAPVPGSDQVLIETEAATVNPVDVMWADGFLHRKGIVGAGQSVGLGWDAVGVVTKLGSDVTGLKIGDRVAATLTTFGTPLGAIAEQVVASSSDIALLPDGLSSIDAAAIGMNALAASQALELVGPANNRTLLVTGAAGALGGFVVELAGRDNWHVTGLARKSDGDFLAKRGARLITEVDGTYDAVIDAAGLQDGALPAVARGGQIVGVIGLAPLPESSSHTVRTQQVHSDGSRLGELLELARKGELTARIQATIPLSRAAEAIATTRSGGRRGRIIVVPD